MKAQLERLHKYGLFEKNMAVRTNRKTSGTMSFKEMRPNWRQLTIMHSTTIRGNQTQNINNNTSYKGDG